MIPHRIEKIKEPQLQELVDQSVRENDQLDYKLKELERHKLLKSVCAFANTSGGDVVLGIGCQREDNAIPEALVGLETASPDELATSIDQMIRSGLDPALATYRVQPIPLSSGRTAVVVRVWQSWQRSHRLTRSEKFYGRASTHVYALSVAEIRRAVLGAEGITEKIRRFVADRLIAVRAGEMPVPLVGGAWLVLHLIPLGALEPGSKLLSMRQLANIAVHPIKLQSSIAYKPTLEGRAWWSPSTKTESAVHLHRSGLIEGVDTYHLGYTNEEYGPLIDGQELERDLISSLQHYLRRFSGLGVPPPAYAFLSLLAAAQHRLGTPGGGGWYGALGRDTLTLPEVVIHDFGASARELLREPLGRLWNACGADASPITHPEDEEM